MRDAALFLGGDTQFRVRVIRQTLLEEREHLFARLARRANDKDKTEPLFVSAIERHQLGERLFGSRARRRLLFGRPARSQRRLHSLRLLLSDLRMMAESFHPS